MADHQESESGRRLRRATEELVSCMNDTKWREVFRLVARHELQFHVAFVRSSPGWFETPGRYGVYERIIGEDMLLDPGLGGGPCFYREFLWIRVPFRIPSEYWGGPFAQNLEPFIAELKSLGQLPVTVTRDHVEIRGYQQPNEA